MQSNNYYCRKNKYCYWLGKSFYIPWTSRCNTTTLPETRGPRFVLPAHVVSSLCRLRDAEKKIDSYGCSTTNYKPKWSQWCAWLETQDDQSKHKLPPLNNNNNHTNHNESSNIASIYEYDSTRYKPIMKELLDEVINCSKVNWDSIVIAGEGEPTLKMDSLIEFLHLLQEERETKYAMESAISNHSLPPVRIVTNGLVGEAETDKLLNALSQKKSCGINLVDSFSVALMTNNADQYDSLMQPLLISDKRPYHVVCDFIRALVEAQIKVELTAVDRSDINKSATEKIAKDLGVLEPVRWRTYFP